MTKPVVHVVGHPAPGHTTRLGPRVAEIRHSKHAPFGLGTLPLYTGVTRRLVLGAGDVLMLRLRDDRMWEWPSPWRQHTHMYADARAPIQTYRDGTRLSLLLPRKYALLFNSLLNNGFSCSVQDFGITVIQSSHSN